MKITLWKLAGFLAVALIYFAAATVGGMPVGWFQNVMAQSRPPLEVTTTDNDMSVRVNLPWSTLRQLVKADQYYNGAARQVRVTGFLTDGSVRSDLVDLSFFIETPRITDVQYIGSTDVEVSQELRIREKDFSYVYTGQNPVHFVITNMDAGWDAVPEDGGYKLVPISESVIKE